MTIKNGELAAIARRLLEEGRVSSVIAYGPGSHGDEAQPLFIVDPDEADRMVWDPSCVHNLATYVVDEKRRQATLASPDRRPVGVVVKGCDSRSIVVLLQERFIERQDVYLIGVSCAHTGVIDARRLGRLLDGQEVLGVAFGESDSFVVTTAGGDVPIPASDILADRCRECIAPLPVLYDALVGEVVERPVADPFGSLRQFASLGQEERWSFWAEQFDKCIRCYACRSTCPMCYCDECVADTIRFAVTAETTAEEKAQRIKWVEKSPVASENAFYHLVRAIHLAGRCTDCGECERCCPVNIPLRLLNKYLEKEAKVLFGYDVGFDPTAPALVSCFRDDDPGDFIR